MSGMPCYVDKWQLCGSWLKLGLSSSTAGRPILKLIEPLLAVLEAKLLLLHTSALLQRGIVLSWAGLWQEA